MHDDRDIVHLLSGRHQSATANDDKAKHMLLLLILPASQICLYRTIIPVLARAPFVHKSCLDKSQAVITL